MVFLVLFPIFPCSPCYPSLTPFVLFSTYLRPPVVTGIVLPLLRLLVNWPYLPPPFNPIVPPSPTSHSLNCPTPDNDDIGTAPLWLCGTNRCITKLSSRGKIIMPEITKIFFMLEDITFYSLLFQAFRTFRNSPPTGRRMSYQNSSQRREEDTSSSFSPGGRSECLRISGNEQLISACRGHETLLRKIYCICNLLFWTQRIVHISGGRLLRSLSDFFLNCTFMAFLIKLQRLPLSLRWDVGKFVSYIEGVIVYRCKKLYQLKGFPFAFNCWYYLLVWTDKKMWLTHFHEVRAAKTSSWTALSPHTYSYVIHRHAEEDIGTSGTILCPIK